MALYPRKRVNTPEGVGTYIATIFTHPLRAVVRVNGKRRVFLKSQLIPYLPAYTPSKRTVISVLESELAHRDAALAEAVGEIARLRSLNNCIDEVR